MSNVATELSGADSIESAADFSAAIAAIRVVRGLSIRQLSRSTGIPTATLGGYFSGRHLPALTQPRVLEDLLDGLGIAAEDYAAWRAALVRARNGLQQVRREPYLGLASYTAADADIFFGRDSAIEQLREALTAARASAIRVLTVVGPSGAGKSSLVLAGLVPELAEGSWQVITPGERPAENLSQALKSPIPPQVLVIDQFEEVLRLPMRASDRSAFTARLADLARDPDGPIVVATLRADRLTDAMSDPVLFELVAAHQVLVGPMTEAGLRAAITEPARIVGAGVGPGLVDVVVRDLGEIFGDAPALPFLSHAMRQTWARSAGRPMTVSEYVASGGIAGSIERTAEEAYADLSPELQIAARAFFGQLVVLGSDGTVARRSMSDAEIGELPDDVLDVVERFIGARVLTADEGSIQLAHEALLRAWPRLAAWVSEDQDKLRTRRRLREAALHWHEAGEHPADLARGALLTQAEELLDGTSTQIPLSDDESRFLTASRAQAASDLAAEVSRRRRLVALLAVVATLALVATTLAVYLGAANASARRARTRADVATSQAISRATALQALRVSTTDPGLAANLALAAYKIAPTPEARAQVIEAAARGTVTRLVGGPGQTHAVMSPDGRTFVLAENDGSVQVWQRPSATTVPTLRGRAMASKGNPQYAAAFSSDGRTVAVGGAGQVTLLDVSNATHPVVMDQVSLGKATAYDVAFNPSGTELAVATSANGVVTYSLSGGHFTPGPSRSDLTGMAKSVAYSPDGAQVAIATDDGSLTLTSATDLTTQAALVPVTGAKAFYVAYAPSGKQVAVATNSGGVAIVDLAPKPHVVKILGDYPSWVNGVAYDATGSRLAAAASNGILRVYDTSSWQVVASSSAATNFTSPAFVSSDQVLASGVDGVARIVDLRSGAADGAGSEIWNIASAEGGREFFAVTFSGVTQYAVGGPDDLRLVRSLPLPGGQELSGAVATTSDGRLVIAGLMDGGLLAWSFDGNGNPGSPQALPLDGGAPVGVAVSGDGRFLAVANQGGFLARYAISDGVLNQLGTLDTKTSPYTVGINRDGSVLAVGTLEAKLQLYRPAADTFTRVSTVSDFTNYVSTAVFTPDSRKLVVGGQDRVARVYDVTDPARPKQVGRSLTGATDALFNGTVSSDGRLFGAAASSGGPVLWRIDPAARGQMYAPLNAVGKETAAIGAGGPWIVSGGDAGVVQQWFANGDSAAAFLCSRIGSTMSPGEWRQYVVGAKPRAYC